MNNDKRNFRVIGEKNGLYLVTRDPKAKINDILEKGFIVDSSGKVITAEFTIGTLTKDGYWNALNGMYYEYIEKNCQNYCENALLGAAVGDAFGVPYEFLSRDDIANLEVSEMIGCDTNPKFRSRWSQLIPSGSWSDDTSMIVATMDSMVKLGNIDYYDIMHNYLRWWNNSDFSSNDYPFGLGGTVSVAFHNFKMGVPVEECGGKDYMDNGNGSLMRILPFSLYCIKKDLNDEQTYEIISKGSSITHGNEISIMACYMYTIFLREVIRTRNIHVAYEKMIFTDYRNLFSVNTILQFRNIINKNLKEKNIKESGYVVDTFEAVVYSLLNSNNYKDTIIQCIKLGYDTDTIACIAGSIAGVAYGYEKIPKEWLDKLKRREYLEKLGIEFDNSIQKEIPKNIKH